jgi:hypothetical protein
MSELKKYMESVNRFTLKMDAESSTETPVPSYQTTRRHTPIKQQFSQSMPPESRI